jgi:signal transduction histidine kinase
VSWPGGRRPRWRRRGAAAGRPATGTVGWIRLRTGSRDAAAYLEIANSGPLVPDHAVPELFEPFRRLKARTGAGDGVGLGLSIARSVLTAHHATITASSQPGGGLHISVVIPQPQGSGPAGLPAVSPHAP